MDRKTAVSVIGPILLAACVATTPIDSQMAGSGFGRYDLTTRYQSSFRPTQTFQIYLKSFDRDGQLAFCGAVVGESRKPFDLKGFSALKQQTRIRLGTTILADLDFMPLIDGSSAGEFNQGKFFTNCVVTGTAWDQKYQLRNLKVTRWVPR